MTATTSLMGKAAAGTTAGAGAALLVFAGSANAGQGYSQTILPQEPAPAPASSVPALIQPVEELQVDLSVLDEDENGEGSAGAAQRKSGAPDREAGTHTTGDLPGGRAVPMKDFRVGPLFGRVGGPHTGGVHSGLDMGADQGTPVSAISDGKVEVAGWQGAAGKSVTIVTASGKRILYGHLSRLNVSQGEKVAAGDRIGAVGSTGNSTGPHLHLGVTKPDGQNMDPLNWMGISAKDLAKFGKD